MSPPEQERHKRNQKQRPRYPWIHIKVTAYPTAHATQYLFVGITVQPFTYPVYQYIAAWNKGPKKYVSNKADTGKNENQSHNNGFYTYIGCYTTAYSTEDFMVLVTVQPFSFHIKISIL